MKSIVPHITFENCKEAIEYYKSIFGGEEKNIQLANKNPMFGGYEGKIIHAELHINENCIIYMTDNFGRELKSNFVDLIIEMDSEEEINRVYKELSKEGNVKFELQKTFWGALHAMITDKYGVTWGLNYTIK